MKFYLIASSATESARSRVPFAQRIYRTRGSSLLVMMITVVLILVGIAATRYEKSVLRAREATLMQDCFVMRNAIQQYTLDKHTAPTSMDDLVRAEYLAAAPIDPITHEKLFGSRLRSWTRKLHGSRPDNSWC